jgi:hypothetical protein
MPFNSPQSARNYKSAVFALFRIFSGDVDPHQRKVEEILAANARNAKSEERNQD